MFTALTTHETRTEEVNLLLAHMRQQGDDHKRHLRSRSYVCKFCGGEMLPRFPVYRRWHFYHKRDSAQCPYRGESEEHLLLKYQLVEHWAGKEGILPEHFRLEHRLDIGAEGRIADIYLEHRGHRLAFEVQLSPIPLDQFQQRSLDYDNAGIRVYWVLEEGNRWHDEHRRWLAVHGFSFISVRYEATTHPERL